MLGDNGNSGVPAADLSGADLLKAWPSMGQQLGAVHSLSVDQCPFERRLSRMFGRAVDVVSRNAVNPDFLPDEDKSTPQLDLLARVERELPVRLDQSAPIWLFAMVIPACRTSWWTLKLFNARVSIDLGRLGTADRYADLALMIANAEENWAAPDEAERAFAVLFNVLGIEAPDRERLASICDWTLDLGLMFMPPVFLLIGTFRNLFSLRTPFPASFGKFHCQTGLLQSSRD